MGSSGGRRSKTRMVIRTAKTASENALNRSGVASWGFPPNPASGSPLSLSGRCPGERWEQLRMVPYVTMTCGKGGATASGRRSWRLSGAGREALPTHPTTWKAFIMKATRLLLAAILAVALGAPIEALAEDKRVTQAGEARSGSVTH